MDTRHKQKRQDEARQPAQTPIADAIVIGTAAGGLVLGTMQAQAAAPDGGDDQLVSAGGEGLEPALQTAAVTASDAAPVDDLPAQSADPVPSTAIPAQPTIENGALATDIASAAEPMATPVQDQLVQALSQQMAGTIEKVIQGAEPGVSAADFSQSISSDIVQSAQDIVAGLDIGSLLSETQGIAGRLLTQIDPDGIVAEVLGATSDLPDQVLSDVGTLLEQALGNTPMALVGLPSSLLGNEGADGPDGLLSSLFYMDGASEGLSIPDTSSAASSVVGDLTAGPTGLLGLSYMDVADHQSGQGINALSLL